MLTPGVVVHVLRGGSAGSLGTVVYAWEHLGEVLVRLHRPGDPLAVCAIDDVAIAPPDGAPQTPERPPGDVTCAPATGCRCARAARGPTTFCFDPNVAEVAEGILWGATTVGYALFRALTGGDHPFDPPGPTRRMVNAVRRHSWSCQKAKRRRRCASRRMRCRTEPPRPKPPTRSGEA